MGIINLYKIDFEKNDLFLQEVQNKMPLQRVKERDHFECSLFIDQTSEKRDLSWKWILKEFQQNNIQVAPLPKGLLVV